MIKLTEIYKIHSEYRLRELYVNPQHVVAMREDERVATMLGEGVLPENLDHRQDFTKLYIDRGHTGIDVTVIGDLDFIREKLGLTSKSLLKG